MSCKVMHFSERIIQIIFWVRKHYIPEYNRIRILHKECAKNWHFFYNTLIFSCSSLVVNIDFLYIFLESRGTSEKSWRHMKKISLQNITAISPQNFRKNSKGYVTKIIADLNLEVILYLSSLHPLSTTSLVIRRNL